MPSFFLTLVTLAASTTAALAQHAEHGNHSADWEWAGGFESLANSTLALASNGIDHVMVLVIAADEADEHGIEESEEAAEAIWDAGNATEVEHGGTLSNTNVLYELHLDESFLNLFTVALNATGPQIIFFEHAPSELEFKHPAMHYIKSSIDGEDIEPTAVEAAGHGEEAATPSAPRAKTIDASRSRPLFRSTFAAARNAATSEAQPSGAPGGRTRSAVIVVSLILRSAAAVAMGRTSGAAKRSTVRRSSSVLDGTRIRTVCATPPSPARARKM